MRRLNYRVTENEDRKATLRGCCSDPNEKRCGSGPRVWQKHGEEKKASKDVKEDESSEQSTSLGIGHKREEELGGSQSLGESGGAADLQEERYEALHFGHVLFAVPLEHPCGDD